MFFVRSWVFLTIGTRHTCWQRHKCLNRHKKRSRVRARRRRRGAGAAPSATPRRPVPEAPSPVGGPVACWLWWRPDGARRWPRARGYGEQLPGCASPVPVGLRPRTAQGRRALGGGGCRRGGGRLGSHHASDEPRQYTVLEPGRESGREPGGGSPFFSQRIRYQHDRLGFVLDRRRTKVLDPKRRNDHDDLAAGRAIGFRAFVGRVASRLRRAKGGVDELQLCGQRVRLGRHLHSAIQRWDRVAITGRWFHHDRALGRTAQRSRPDWRTSVQHQCRPGLGPRRQPGPLRQPGQSDPRPLPRPRLTFVPLARSRSRSGRAPGRRDRHVQGEPTRLVP